MISLLGIGRHRLVTGRIPFLALSALVCVIFTGIAAGEERGANPRARKLSLRVTIQAAIDSNVVCGC
jgi:hypothetical protein